LPGEILAGEAAEAATCSSAAAAALPARKNQACRSLTTRNAQRPMGAESRRRISLADPEHEKKGKTPEMARVDNHLHRCK